MKNTTLLVLDAAIGDAPDQARNRLLDLGVCAGIHSVAPHGRRVTCIRFDELQDRYGVRVRDLKDVHARQYLSSKYSANESFLETCHVIGVDKPNGGERLCVVQHPPIERYRIVLPLAHPRPIIARGDYIPGWSRFTDNVKAWLDIPATQLRLASPARRCNWPNAHLHWDEAQVEFLTGALLDWRDFD